MSAAKTCTLVTLPTRMFTNKFGITASAYIDHIFTNMPEHCFKAVSVALCSSDHNLIAIMRKNQNT